MTDNPVFRHGVLQFAKWAVERGTFAYPDMLEQLKVIGLYEFREAIGTMTATIHEYRANEMPIDMRVLTPEALFGYLQFVELEQAMQSAAEAQKDSAATFAESKEANRIANRSFWIAVASMVISVVFSVWEILKC